jgi:hypothetical protein
MSAALPLTKAQRDKVALAAWLVDETALSFDQIAEYAGIQRTWVKLIADEHPAFTSGARINPVALGHLSTEEIAAVAQDPGRLLPKPAPRREGGPYLFKSVGPRLLTADDQDLLARPIYAAGVTAAWRATYGRNAWHSTWIGRYGTGWSLWLHEAEAKKACERQRVQGSVFYLDLIPAIYLRGPGYTIFAADVNDTAASSQLLHRLQTEDDLKFLLKWSEIFPTDSIHVLMHDEDLYVAEWRPVENSSRFFVSKPAGASRDLRWVPNAKVRNHDQALIDCALPMKHLAASLAASTQPPDQLHPEDQS